MSVCSSEVSVDENDDDFERPSHNPRESVVYADDTVKALGELESGLHEGVEIPLKFGEYSRFHSLQITD